MGRKGKIRDAKPVIPGAPKKTPGVKKGTKRKPITGIAVTARIAKAFIENGGASTDSGKKAAKDSIDDYSAALMKKALQFARHANRKRVTNEDIELARKYMCGDPSLR